MATPRFYSSTALTAHQTIELPQELAHHAIRVLRLKAGTSIVLFDGRGGQFPATLQIEGKKGFAQTGAHDPVEAELPGEITLVQGIASGDKMDWIIEKAVELGAARVIPITAQRSVLQLSGDRLIKRQRHWERIALSASEQCGRNRIMAIDAPVPLQHYMQQIDPAGQQLLFCHPEAEQTLAQALTPAITKITLLIGPEGGWSADEQALVKRHGIEPVRFGGRVLRTETAGLALIAATSALQRWY
ncbi:MAG TPA: 16S rRNA (uracil(1498)-N(3))-methyltransferase [Eoetvoesiella sp.]